MNLTLWIFLAVAIIGVLALKRLSFLSAEKARQFLREGALVVDVRNPGEFNTGHVPGAVNVPLGDLRTEAPKQFPDRDRILLLHCLSGARSGIAKGQLKALGYRNVYNLGSYGRAEQIARTAARSS